MYKVADKDDSEALLEGVAMAGLIGVLRQLGDLAELVFLSPSLSEYGVFRIGYSLGAYDVNFVDYNLFLISKMAWSAHIGNFPLELVEFIELQWGFF